MAIRLKPGNISPVAEPWINDPRFADSMAEAIEQELDALMAADNLPHLDIDASQTAVRDRRRLFVAIARGVVRHLAAQRGAIKVYCEDDETKPVTVIDVDYS